MKVWCVCRSLPWETLRNALQCHKYLRQLWCESRKYLFVCSSLYDDLLYFVSHGLAITPGNWIIYTKKMTIILTKDSGTRENVFYIYMGDCDLLRFNKKCLFPVIVPHWNIDSAIFSEYSSIGWSWKALLSRSLANVLCSRAHPCTADGTCNNLAFGKYRHDICQNKYMSRFSGRKFYTLKASKLIFSLTKNSVDVSMSVSWVLFV